MCAKTEAMTQEELSSYGLVAFIGKPCSIVAYLLKARIVELEEISGNRTVTIRDPLFSMRPSPPSHNNR
jgi:hypothetical protein